MRKTLSPEIERGRILVGYYGSVPNSGPIGAFTIKSPYVDDILRIIACDAGPDTQGWEHVSVSTNNRCPFWEEMCFIKGLFWEAEECVFQLHPPESEYINFHPYALHLWRNVDRPVPKPPSAFVGIQLSAI
jgi:hypothetical protein